MPSAETNNTIFTTVALKDADHSMNFLDNSTPMYLIDKLANRLYSYFYAQGFSLDASEAPSYNGGDVYQYNKYKRNWYRYYFAGIKWASDSKGGITKEMWPTLPTNK